MKKLQIDPCCQFKGIKNGEKEIGDMQMWGQEEEESFGHEETKPQKMFQDYNSQGAQNLRSSCQRLVVITQ